MSSIQRINQNSGAPQCRNVSFLSSGLWASHPVRNNWTAWNLVFNTAGHQNHILKSDGWSRWRVSCRIKDSPLVSRPGCFEAAATVSLRHTPVSGVNSTQFDLLPGESENRLHIFSLRFAGALWKYTNSVGAYGLYLRIWRVRRFKTEKDYWRSWIFLFYRDWFMFRSVGNPEAVYNFYVWYYYFASRQIQRTER
jgi:hypothetical protein